MHASLFHLGHLHIPVFSAFLALGLIAALLLSQRTAQLAGLLPQAMWDAGLAAAISAFVISRLLLVFTNLKSFLSYPLLILSFPSITVSGLLLTVAVLFVYLRLKHLPSARVLDAAAAPLALLWAITSLGSFANGSTGMPTTLPWSIQDAVLGPIHPVELYTVVAALALCALLYRALPFAAVAPGKTAATGLFLAGAILFFLDFLTQPAATSRLFLLDPAQWLALAMLLAGVFSLLPHLAATPLRQPLRSEPSSPHAI